jgi:hypothetical protein
VYFSYPADGPSQVTWSRILLLPVAVDSKILYRWHSNTAKTLFIMFTIDGNIRLASLNAFRKLVWRISANKHQTRNNTDAAGTPY